MNVAKVTVTAMNHGLTAGFSTNIAVSWIGLSEHARLALPTCRAATNARDPDLY